MDLGDSLSLGLSFPLCKVGITIVVVVRTEGLKAFGQRQAQNMAQPHAWDTGSGTSPTDGQISQSLWTSVSSPANWGQFEQGRCED